MTIGAVTVQTSGSTGNGVTTAFSFSFHVDDYGDTEAEDQIEVIRETIATGAEEILVRTTDYTVTINGDQDASPGGSVTMLSAPSSSFKIWIRLAPDFTQQTDYQNQGGFLMETVEDQADQHTRQILALKDIARRAPHVGIQAGTSFDGEVTGDLTAGYTFIVNQALTGYTLGAPSSVAVSAAMTPVVQAATVAQGAANLGTVQVYNVKSATYGALGDGSTNDTTAIQLAATACREAGGGVLYFPPGTYIIRSSIIVGSNTRVMGAGMDATVIKADQASFTGTNAANDCYLIRNYTHTLSGVVLTDSDISVEELTLDYGTVTIVSGGAHAIAMAGVSRVTVRRVRGLEGENVTAFRGCVDTLVDNCHGFGQSNCFFDHWEGGGNNHVINCTGRLTSGAIAFGIMFTGTGSGGENLSTTDCLVAFCSLYGVRNATDNAPAINSNAQDADSTTYRFRSIGNYVEDSDYGFTVTGEGGQAVSIGDTFRQVDLPVFISTSDSDTPDHCRVIGPTMIDCGAAAAVALVAVAGTYHAVKGVKVVNTGAAAYPRIGYFGTGSTNCLIEIEEGAVGTATRWTNDGGASNRVIDYDPALATVVHHQAFRAPVAGLLSGMTLANNGSDATNDIDFAAGYCADSTGAALITCAALTKRLDANWVVGTNQGGLDTGSIANTTYHCFAIRKDSDGSGDFLFSTSPTAPTMPAGYTYFRRIGSILRLGATILAFSQSGDEFLLSAPYTEANTNNPGTSAVLQAFTRVPAGLKLNVLFSGFVQDNTADTATHLLFTSPDQTDTAPTTAICSLTMPPEPASAAERAAGMFRIRCDTSQQIRYRVDNSTTDHTVRLTTHGWIDTRGRV